MVLGPTASPTDVAAFDAPGGREPSSDEGVAAVALAVDVLLAGEDAVLGAESDRCGRHHCSRRPATNSTGERVCLVTRA
jgi:hypothetical protein